MKSEDKLTNGEISEFCRRLALLIHAGIRLGDGLFLMAEEESGDKKAVLETMGRNADLGMVLSQSMKETGKFPVYVTGMVNVGETSGRLEEALLALAGYYEEQERMNRQIKSVLTYPSILMVMMVAVIGVLLVKVLPVFDDVYASLGGQLTGVAGGLLKFGQMIGAAMPLICLVLAAAAAACLMFSRNLTFRKTVLDHWQAKYGDQGVSRMINDAHFAQALAMGLKSGLPIEEAVQLAGEVMRDVPGAAARCSVCVEGLMHGESLSDVLKRSEILPPSSCRLLELGIRGGNGDAVMDEIAAKLSEEAGYALQQKVARIEPAMVMTASVLVGFILLSVMLPLMHIMTAIG